VLLDAPLRFPGADRLRDEAGPEGVGRVLVWIEPGALGVSFQDGGDVLRGHRRFADRFHAVEAAEDISLERSITGIDIPEKRAW
jgi:hypothetical protein